MHIIIKAHHFSVGNSSSSCPSA